MKQITVFTPTYNRAYILGQAYESLKKQTNKEFIWLIIDDGSTDNTLELVENWKKENKIEIQYIKQKNAGKHVAHNTAVKNCKTDFLLILDSDDFLSEKAIEILGKEIKEIEQNEKISGIIGNKYIATEKKVIGSFMPDDFKFASGLELYQKYGFHGDTLRMYKTKILKQFLFPTIKGEKFIYENVVFDAIDNKYKMLITKEELYYCEYLEDGYTNNANNIKKQNPRGYALSLKSSAENSIKILEKIKYAILYIIWCRRYNIKIEYKNLNNKKIYIYLISYPVAVGFEKFKFPRFFFDN